MSPRQIKVKVLLDSPCQQEVSQVVSWDGRILSVLSATLRESYSSAHRSATNGTDRSFEVEQKRNASTASRIVCSNPVLLIADYCQPFTYAHGRREPIYLWGCSYTKGYCRITATCLLLLSQIQRCSEELHCARQTEKLWDWFWLCELCFQSVCVVGNCCRLH